MSLPLVRRLPDPWRKVVDWVRHACCGGRVRTRVRGGGRRSRSGSRRPRWRAASLCASPGPGCTGSMSDRVLVNRLAYDFGSPQRGQIVVFTAPPKANDCQAGDGGTTFVKRLIGLPGETVREDGQGFIWIRRGRLEDVDEARRAVCLEAESTRRPQALRPHVEDGAARRLLHARRQPGQLVRLAHVGTGSEGRPRSARSSSPTGRRAGSRTTRAASEPRRARRVRSPRRSPGRSRCTSLRGRSALRGARAPRRASK